MKLKKQAYIINSLGKINKLHDKNIQKYNLINISNISPEQSFFKSIRHDYKASSDSRTVMKMTLFRSTSIKFLYFITLYNLNCS